MKKALPGIGVIAVILVAGIVFSILPSLQYTQAGTGGVLQTVGVIMSTCYFLAFMAASVWLGYKKWTPSFVALGIVFMLVGIMGLMGYMGYGFLLEGLASLYFLFITPFAALIENLAMSWNMYYAADGFMLIVPLVIYFLSMGFYIVGTVLRANRRALHYSLIRLNRRYEYRLPLEEVYALAKDNGRGETHTA